jgi:hypothetical protein
MAAFVVSTWQELQRYNASGGYTVEVLWNTALDRELTPAEAVGMMVQQRVAERASGGKGGKGNKGGRR